jgi:peptide/nickel transport system ATP-binding protein
LRQVRHRDGGHAPFAGQSLSRHQGRDSVLGQDMLAASEADLLRLRGSDVAMIFQEPLTALNPTRRIGDLMVEVIRAHQKITKTQAQAKAVDLLQQMRIADAKAVSAAIRFSFQAACASAS